MKKCDKNVENSTMPREKNMDDFYTVEQFARKLKLHPNSVRRKIGEGKIQAINLGLGRYKIWRIPKDEIERLGVFDLENLINKVVDERTRKI